MSGLYRIVCWPVRALRAPAVAAPSPVPSPRPRVRRAVRRASVGVAGKAAAAGTVIACVAVPLAVVVLVPPLDSGLPPASGDLVAPGAPPFWPAGGVSSGTGMRERAPEPTPVPEPGSAALLALALTGLAVARRARG